MIDRGCIQSPQVNIRAANVSDIPFIQGIARSTWADTYRGVIPEDAQAAVLNQAYSKGALSISIGRNQAFLVAEVRDTPGTESSTLAAYVDVDADFDGQQMNLHRLYVLPQYQRLGLGRRLFEAAIQSTLGRMYERPDEPIPIVAHVERDNPRARAFYRKMGFIEGDEEIVVIGGISLPVIRISMTIKGDGRVPKNRPDCR